jgi:hypothetical protein
VTPIRKLSELLRFDTKAGAGKPRFFRTRLPVGQVASNKPPQGVPRQVYRPLNHYLSAAKSY